MGKLLCPDRSCLFVLEGRKIYSSLAASKADLFVLLQPMTVHSPNHHPSRICLLQAGARVLPIPFDLAAWTFDYAEKQAFKLIDAMSCLATGNLQRFKEGW